MKKFRVLYLLVALFVVGLVSLGCRNGIDNLDNEDDPSNREIISNPGQVNVFKNGDVVFFNPNGISEIHQTITDSSFPTVLDNMRDFRFKFSAEPMSLSYTVNIMSIGKDWRLCSFNGDAWVELKDSVYSDNTNRVSIDITVSLDTDILDNEYSIKVAFVKTDEFIKNIEVKQNPYDNNPFGALITFDSGVEVVPTMRLLGKHNNDIVRSFPGGGNILLMF